VHHKISPGMDPCSQQHGSRGTLMRPYQRPLSILIQQASSSTRASQQNCSWFQHHLFIHSILFGINSKCIRTVANLAKLI
jgi:hypothetical protein